MLQGVLVEAHAHRPAFGPQDFAVRRADADRVDPHPPIGGDSRRFDRIGSRCRLSIAQQDDHRRCVRPRRHGLLGRFVRRTRLIERDAALRIAGGFPTGIGCAQIEFNIRENRLQRDENSTADRRAALKLQTIDGRRKVFVILRRRLHDRRRRRKSDNAYARTVRLLGDEAFRGSLRGGDPARLHVGGPHAARDVERENHGFVLRGQCDDRRRSRDRDDHQRERNQKEQRGYVAADATALALRFLDHAEACVAKREFFSSPQHDEVRGDRERDDSQ